MADSSKKEALEREALGYIQLGTLVQVSRTEDMAEAVAKVLAEGLSVEEKIRKIKLIDAGLPLAEKEKPNPNPSSRVVSPAAPAGPAPTMVRSKQSLATATRIRTHIKADVDPSLFMNYLFREGGAIRSKAKGNRFLKAGLFSVHLENEAARFFVEAFKREESPALMTAVEATLREGWRFLRKMQYNRIAALGKMVSDLVAVGPYDIAAADPPSQRRFFNLEISFLALRADGSSIAEIVAAFEGVLSKLSYPKKAINEARSASRRLLQQGGPPPCLQDLILAVNMQRSRRYLRVADLIKPGVDGFLSASEFDCSDEIQDAIDKRIAELMEKLGLLEEESEEMLKLRAFVRRDGGGNIDFGSLPLLYESDRDSKRSYEKDENNIMLLLLGLIERFLAMIGPLTGPAGENPSLYIEDAALNYNVSRLRNAAAKLETIRSNLPKLPWARYLAIKARSAQATKYEAEGAGLVNEAADLFYRSGSRLAELLRSREGIPTGGAHASKPAENAELSLEQLALRQSLSDATTAAYLVALRFQEPSISVVLKNERQATDQRLSLLDEIGRLADAETYKAARQKAGLTAATGD